VLKRCWRRHPQATRPAQVGHPTTGCEFGWHSVQVSADLSFGSGILKASRQTIGDLSSRSVWVSLLVAAEILEMR